LFWPHKARASWEAVDHALLSLVLQDNSVATGVRSGLTPGRGTHAGALFGKAWVEDLTRYSDGLEEVAIGAAGDRRKQVATPGFTPRPWLRFNRRNNRLHPFASLATFCSSMKANGLRALKCG
jgi:hypothetical protein